MLVARSILRREPLLLQGYSILKAANPDAKETPLALRAIIDFYEACGKPEKAAEYRAMLVE